MDLQTLYRPNLSLLTDLYQLTMAYGYWKQGRQDDEAVFNLFYRKQPFNGGFAIAAGLEAVVDFIKQLSFEDEDLAYLATLEGNDGQPLFEQGFLDYLGQLTFTGDIDAMPEGTVVFPHEPLLRVRANLILGQLLETPLLNMVNFQTLIATKAARICRAAQGEPVLEFGLRRAQGIDGALSASRAAFIGGTAATSNVLAGKLYGIPVKGTHAHSWVMSFDDEMAAFEAYAAAMPNNCVFLVDTYDTVEGVKKAIEVGQQLRQRGYEMLGIRLDSGDLAWLSIEARTLLDAAGFTEAKIVASNDLDEFTIASLKQQGAKIAIWGVGTKLVTAYDQPALGGVYKLAAIRAPGEDWRYTIKLSEQRIKVSNPGILNVRRYQVNGQFVADVLFNEEQENNELRYIIDPNNDMRRRKLETEADGQNLLVSIFRDGECVAVKEGLDVIRNRAARQLGMFYEGCLRLDNPHNYPVGLEPKLHELKASLIEAAMDKMQTI